MVSWRTLTSFKSEFPMFSIVDIDKIDRIEWKWRGGGPGRAGLPHDGGARQCREAVQGRGFRFRFSFSFTDLE
jgi:hypothetical protein